jgi:hypothetical protein
MNASTKGLSAQIAEVGRKCHISPFLFFFFFFFFFFHWHYSPLWALACRTRSFHFSLSVTNCLHHRYIHSAFSFFRLS